ncbi:MAG TPA: hypothetical protein VLF43_03105 [Candidatus Saccharimonadales bacterium]|nr:hypothetical protein [Candidatus Saccharimonadales bacterium]
MRVYRLEFLQPDGRWTGPYCAEWMTPAAFEIRERMLEPHRNSEYHAFPDEQIFIKNPGKDRYVCGSSSEALLYVWFGEYMKPFLAEGGHIGIYDVPNQAITHDDSKQIVYQQRQATLILRSGTPVETKLLIEKIHPTKHKPL